MSQTESQPPKTEAERALASEAKLDSPEAAALSQWQLIKIGFYKHRLAVISLFVLGVLYFVALFAEFFAPYSKDRYDVSHTYSPPQRIAFSFERGLHSFEMEQRIDPLTFQRSYVEQADKPLPLSFLAPGEPYKLWGLIPLRHHFFGLDHSQDMEAAMFPSNNKLMQREPAEAAS